ncbi:uncharacterized protein LOC144120007 [Amblyomma americanum]
MVLMKRSAHNWLPGTLKKYKSPSLALRLLTRLKDGHEDRVSRFGLLLRISASVQLCFTHSRQFIQRSRQEFIDPPSSMARGGDAVLYGVGASSWQSFVVRSSGRVIGGQDEDNVGIAAKM